MKPMKLRLIDGRSMSVVASDVAADFLVVTSTSGDSADTLTTSSTPPTVELQSSVVVLPISRIGCRAGPAS